jgi:hypothetical protein
VVLARTFSDAEQRESKLAGGQEIPTFCGNQN